MTLLELLAYQAGLLIVITASLGVITTLTVLHKSYGVELHHRTTMEYIYGLLEHDLLQSTQGLNIADDVVVQAEDQVVRWYCHKSCLVRSSNGIKKRHRSIVMKDIDEFAVRTVVVHSRRYVQMKIKKGAAQFERWFELPVAVV